MGPKVSVIVLTWNSSAFLEPCLAALLKQGYAPLEVIVVDNASMDDSVAVAAKYVPDVQIIQNQRNLGYAGGNNVGIQSSNADIIVLLNPDTVVQTGWLPAIVDTFQDPMIGVVGCKALYPDGRTIQHAGAVLEPASAYAHHVGCGEPDDGQYDRLADCEYVTGVALGIHRRVLNKIGGLDEEFFPAFYEEIDYCYRGRRAGFRVVYQPKALLYHHETASLPSESYARTASYQRNRVRFVLRHRDMKELQAFVATERGAIQVALEMDDLVARARAYWFNLLKLPAIIAQRGCDPTLGGSLSETERQYLSASLRALRRQALQRIYSLVAGQEDSPQGRESAWGREEELLETMNILDLRTLPRELENRCNLREPEMASKIPLLGPLVDRIRGMVISTILRHYVMPMMDQQSLLNTQMVRMLRGLGQVQQIMVADEAVLLERDEKKDKSH